MAHSMPFLMILGMLVVWMAYAWLIVVVHDTFSRHAGLAPLDRVLVDLLILTTALWYAPERGGEGLRPAAKRGRAVRDR
jgi:hypothetical protein